MLVNPAVKPYELPSFVSWRTREPYTQERYVLDESIDDLRTYRLDIPDYKNRLKRFLASQQTEDEVLRLSSSRGKVCRFKDGGERSGDPYHSFIDFERYPAQIIEFLDL